MIIARLVGQKWTERTVTGMVKIALGIFLYIGIVVVHFFVLIATTMVLVKILGKEDADDLDYAMIANIIQFFIMVMVITEKVAQWMP